MCPRSQQMREVGSSVLLHCKERLFQRGKDQEYPPHKKKKKRCQQSQTGLVLLEHRVCIETACGCPVKMYSYYFYYYLLGFRFKLQVSYLLDKYSSTDYICTRTFIIIVSIKKYSKNILCFGRLEKSVYSLSISNARRNADGLIIEGC